MWHIETEILGAQKDKSPRILLFFGSVVLHCIASGELGCMGEKKAILLHEKKNSCQPPVPSWLGKQFGENKKGGDGLAVPAF